MHTAQDNATPNSVFRIRVVIGVILRGYLRLHRVSTTDAVELLCLILTDFINSFHQQNSYSTSTRALSLSRYSPINFSHISSTTFGVILLANIQTNTFDRITHLTVTEVDVTKRRISQQNTDRRKEGKGRPDQRRHGKKRI